MMDERKKEKLTLLTRKKKKEREEKRLNLPITYKERKKLYMKGRKAHFADKEKRKKGRTQFN